MKISMTVCNVCKDPNRSTLSYSVSKDGGRRISLDLCEEHGSPIDALIAESEAPQAQAVAKSRARRAGGKTRTPILTMDEIEKRKGANQS